MTFDSSTYLQRATTRAKSDVANKLISMLLHAVSRNICKSILLNVTDSAYAMAVHDTFGNACGYCGRAFENDRVAIEHPDAMNRFRVGLHIPGNVIVSCKSCNGEKRRDDSLKVLSLAQTGWASFLSHDSSSCRKDCKTCDYWRRIFSHDEERKRHLSERRIRIEKFRETFPKAMLWNKHAETLLRPRLQTIYKECQNFALAAISDVCEEFSKTKLD